MGSSSNKLIIAILLVAALAVGFWMVLVSPKREESKKLSAEAGQLEASVTEARGRLAQAEVAKRAFPADYRQLVVLGKAVPQGDETSSLLVELGKVSEDSKVRFNSITLEEGSGGEESAAPPPTESAATVPPSEAAAALLPLGAAIGPAGLGVLPYNLKFSGNFFHVADFISGIDSLVKTSGQIGVDGRLVTLDGFALTENVDRKFPYLDATFSVTAYVTPPEQGLTAGATSAEPAPVSTETETVEAAPSSQEVPAR
jgi:Tfp pilus assembly protein PilO